jgi:2-dehydropantoate 2-reductase
LTLERVDPGGVIAGSIEARRVIGSIAYFATEIERPGVIRHIEGNRISFGEPDGTKSERCSRIAQALIAAGLRCPVSTRFRQEIWVKLLGNVAFNPISALTGGTLVKIATHPDTSRLVRAVMEETEAVTQRLGIELPISIDQRIAGAAKVGEHKTSMLQDVEAGRSLETEALIGSILEMARMTDTPAPAIESVYALVKLLNKVMVVRKAGVKLSEAA